MEVNSMAPSRAKYRRLPDLYIAGKEVVLADGTVIWMQVLNPLERDEALHDAHVSRSRLVMALKGDTGSDERAKVEGQFLEDGHDVAVRRLVEAKVANQLWKTVEAIQNDSEWSERLEIQARSTDLLSRAMDDPERRLLEQINLDYLNEVQTRQNDERDYLFRHFDGMEDEDLVAEYVELYLERRGTEVANAEFALTETWLAARCCDGVRNDAGEWDHTSCDHHQLRVWELKAEVRSLAEELQLELTNAMLELNMQVREAKNSARQGSSLGSSLLPSGPEASTASTPIETLDELPGISPSLSATLSAS